MPALRSPRSRRSHSPWPSPAGPRDDAPTAAPSSYLAPSSALSSYPSSMRSAPEQDVVAATDTSRSPALDNLTPPPQDSTGRPYADRAQRNSNDQPSQALQPITQISVVDSTPAPKPSACSFVAQEPARLPDILVPTHSIQPQQSLLPQQSSYPLATASQQSLIPERQSYLPQPQDRKQGMFHQSHNFSATGNFIDVNVGSVVHNTTPSNKFMEKLLKETIPGAASDSSARHPPPRCHPGTRLAVLKRCLLFIPQSDGQKKMRWVVGKAGVGKSAIMQSVTESPELTVASNASVFFSINGRDDGTKAIMTLSYQFAAKSAAYRQVIEDDITRDPSLLQSSMPVQFERFIVQPFIRNRQLNSVGRVLIVIDGLDECKNTATQVELLCLISNFCILHPSSPIVWLIASRPEAHITSFFSRAEVMPVYEKEILVDSDEAHADVEQFLRAELTEIGNATDFLGPHWPDERQIWKVAEAAGGLFAYASTVIRYIGDSTIGDPASQLSDVLNVIDEHPILDLPPEEHPMALLDALYARILSKIPSKIMINTRKLLLLLASDWDSVFFFDSFSKNFLVLCNWLGITANEAYAALNRLRSVLEFPQRNEAPREIPRPFHKSFIDYIFRSGFSSDIELEAQQLMTRCAFRVLKETPSGIDLRSAFNDELEYGKLASNIRAGNKIRITWPASEEMGWRDKYTRFSMYKLAIGVVVAGVERGDPVFQSEFCIGILATRFRIFSYNSFPHDELRDLVFDERRRHEYVTLGILKQIPLKAVAAPGRGNYRDINWHLRRPVTSIPLSVPWNLSCKHTSMCQWEQGKEQNWTTKLKGECFNCTERLKRHLESWSIRSPDHAVLIMFTSSQESCVELRFVDPEDGVSEWPYRWWIELSFKKRRKLGSTI